jgi:hypothetical protein
VVPINLQLPGAPAFGWVTFCAKIDVTASNKADKRIILLIFISD